MFKFILTFLCVVFFATPVWSFEPDLMKGCETIAKQNKRVSAADAVDAAYCLGVLDGIMAAVLKRQSNVPLPDPCFEEKTVQPSEVAQNVVDVLKINSQILAIKKSESGDRGGMISYLAMAIADQCNNN